MIVSAFLVLVIGRKKSNNLRSGRPEDLGPSCVRKESNDAGEEACKKNNHAYPHTDTSVGDQQETYDGSYEKDRAEARGNHDAGLLDAFFREVVQAVILNVPVLLLLSKEPAKVRLEEDIEPIGIDGRESDEIMFMFVSDEMFIPTPKNRCRA